MLREERAALLRNAVAIGLAVGAYGLSYGALAVSSGLTALQAQVLSLLLYGGSSQLALVGALTAGSGGPTASATAALLGVRNLFYGVSLHPVLALRRSTVLPAAHLLSDESAAMALGRQTSAAGRFAYWATGAVVFLCWNFATLVGAVAGAQLTDPRALGLDAASSAAFLALVAPRLRERAHQVVFLLACAVSIGVTPLVGAGLPVVIAGFTALGVLAFPNPPLSEAGSQPVARAEGAADERQEGRA